MWRRAQELKQELLPPTVKLPKDRASSYEQSIWHSRSGYDGRRRRGVFLPFCIALVLGAISMTIPVAGTFSLQGTLVANSEPAAAAAEPVNALPEGSAGRALVLAEAAECPWLQMDEPSIVTIDVSAQSDLVLSARILSIEAHAQAEKAPACRVELALIPEGEEAAVLRGLPLGAAARADFPTTRNWIAAIGAQMPSDSRELLEKASAGFRSVSGLVRQLYRTYVAPRLH